METNQIRKALLSALAIIGFGVSASAFAAGSAGSGTSGSTGGFVEPRARGDVAAETPAVSGPVAQLQDPSGRGARNPVDDEGHRVNRTSVDNESTQLASGIGARNFVDRDSDRFDAVHTYQTQAERQ